MPHPLYVAFIWHQHQPLYKSRMGGEYRLPWVRLHGTKDYLDLVLLLDRYPNLHQTVNLVPSLILQLEDYIAGTACDPYLAVALKPDDQLTTEDKHFIVDHFFDGNHRTLIDPHHRYAELYEQRQENGKSWCLENWTLQEYADLLAWHNLAWIDPLFWDDPDIEVWLKQGRNFNLEDRQRIYAKQREIMSRILPQHRQMQEIGQLEVITSPYTHPILPLLADTNAGRVAIPKMELPENRFQWAEDIPRHLRKSWEMYCDRFERSPRGLWPSEQAVSPEILPHIARQGFKWICSDEAILGWTLNHFFHRDGVGNLYEPELLYRPYRLETEQGDLSIVFRDHRLSDLLGFTYATMNPYKAASDLIGHLEAIAHSLKKRQSESVESGLQDPWLVTIALDGENCWEFYERDGQIFLDALYSTLSDDDEIQLVTVSEFLDRFPPTETLPSDRLHSGSWVDGSLTTWIGDPAKNRAWDLLAQARATLAKHPEATEENNPEAWEALYAAEGSDWFWWFGEGHSSNQDAMFDQLFREHLAALYQALNEPIPSEIETSVEDHVQQGDRRPQSFIHPAIDGKADEQDWDKAGRIEVGGARGTMHRSSAIQGIWYGVDHLNFYLRLDFKRGIRPGKDCPPELNLLWYYPDRTMLNSPIPLKNLPDSEPLNYHFRHHLAINLLTRSLSFQEAAANFQWHSRQSRAQVGLDLCLEIAIPWADLPTEPDWFLHVLLVLSQDEHYCEYLPENRLIPIQMP
ncbi:glycoside hydrolase [Oxynema sp. CENA135]|uniref:glycoside hydrolase n=1 Tax=Oxynema sp. CENA135 TaxID=984206 RepID=UPI00190A33CB|nr:glycoside hydrolase [Oxynema sp. CENA135]MBK4731352.1 glycoside hydrolase [Oxynema sp. CENA135]